MTLIKKFAWYGSSVAAATVLALALLVTGPMGVAHALTVGDVSVSLATNAATGSNTSTALGASIVTDAILATNLDGIGDTLVLTAPAGWDFDTAATPTAVASVGALKFGASDNNVVIAANTVTFTTTVANAGTPTITIAGVKVKPETALTAAGNISLASAGDTAQIAVADVATLTPTAANFTAGGGTSTASLVGGTLTTVTAAVPGGLTSATFQTSAGTFTANSGSTLFCGEGVASCDMIGANAIQVQLQLPASGTATVTVTPAGGGTASTITVTTTAAAVLSSVNISTTAISVPASGASTTAFTFQLRDQLGNAFTTSGTITVSTNLGVIDSDGTACETDADGTKDAGSDASCTISNQDGSTYSIQVYGNDAAGTATVTITATIGGNTASGTKTVTVTGGTATALEVFTAGNMTTTATAAKSVIHTVDVTGTAADLQRDELIIIARAKDANGNYIVPTTPGSVVTFKITDAAGNAVNNLLVTAAEDVVATAMTVQTAACDGTINNTAGTCTDTIQTAAGQARAGAVAVIDNERTSTAPLAPGVYTITATLGTAPTILTATTTFTVAGAAETVTVTVAPTSVAVGASTTVTANVVDASGNPVADGTTVNFSVSSGLAALTTTTGTVATSTTTSSGAAAMSLFGLAQGSGQAIAFTGGKSGSAAFTVGSAVVTPPPTEGEGTFASEPAESGVSIVVFNGGTVAQLAETAAGLDVVSVSATVDGAFVVYIVGAPAFVNAAFNAAFPDGLAAGTAVILKK